MCRGVWSTPSIIHPPYLGIPPLPSRPASPSYIQPFSDIKGTLSYGSQQWVWPNISVIRHKLMFMFMSASADPAGFPWTSRQLYPNARPSSVDALRLHISHRAGGNPILLSSPGALELLSRCWGGKGTGFLVFSHQLGISRPGGRWLTCPITHF